MKPKSANALVGAAVISVVLGMIVLSPSGSLLLYILAALFAAVPTIFATKRTRVAGAVILIASLALTAATYPKYAAEMASYRARSQQKAPERSAPPTPQQQESREGERVR